MGLRKRTEPPHERQNRPRSIEQYLAALRVALAGEDPALVQDALYDAEEYLRAEVAANSGGSEADTLELISSTYGAPEEVAEAYRTTESRCAPRLRRRRASPRAPHSAAFSASTAIRAPGPPSSTCCSRSSPASSTSR